MRIVRSWQVPSLNGSELMRIVSSVFVLTARHFVGDGLQMQSRVLRPGRGRVQHLSV